MDVDRPMDTYTDAGLLGSQGGGRLKLTDVDRLKGTDVNGQNETDIDVVKDNCRWTDREGAGQGGQSDRCR